MKPSHKNDYIIIGRIGTAYGVKGWLKVFSFAEIYTNILDFNPWYLEDGEEWKAIHVEEGREHGKGLVAKLAGYETPETARVLTGKNIAILRAQLPKLEKNEYYWSDLQGLTVIDQHGATLGKVIYLIETGSNDVLVVKGEKEYAIPYLPGQVVLSVDLDNQVMKVDWEEPR